ncbi:MAG: asparagine--tRNA ligase [Candidatus Aenigmarchaeota archaeon]|nr:asparagine--tRNA ligase [Candidatus Aenigmarchaeota archaeon]
MDFISVKEAFGRAGEVALRGWCSRVRTQKNIVFVVLRDGSGSIQVAFKEGDVSADAFKRASELTVESSITLTGAVRKDDRAPGGYEVQGRTLDVVHVAERFPIVKDKSPEFLLDVRHLWLRSEQIANVTVVKDTLMSAARDWFRKNEWFETTPPIITASAAEGGSTIFEIDYFGDKAYLSQSAQMYLEALIFPLERVWAITPSFRAETSRTTRHLTEYWHLEAEAAWLDQEANMRVQESLVSAMAQAVGKQCAEQLRALGRDPADLLKIKPPFKRITYDDAIEILKKKGMDVKWGDDLRTEEERALVEGEEKPIFVTNYPAHIKAFYMKLNPDGKTVACADMIAPEGFGEIIGGSQRSEDIEYMKKRLKAEGANLKNYEWYFDLRRFGSVPHSGFGLGIERVVRWFCKLEHIRDATPFPRTLNRFYP